MERGLPLPYYRDFSNACERFIRNATANECPVVRTRAVGKTTIQLITLMEAVSITQARL
jgi:hypothetical protein